jgi:acyl carrier protein
MTKEEILAKVSDVIRETFGVDGFSVTMDTASDDIPGWDSLSYIVLVEAIEQGFGIELSGDTVYSVVGDLVNCIEEKVNGKICPGK